MIICIQRLDEYKSNWKTDSIKPIWAVCPALPGASAQWGRNVCSYHVPAREDFPVPALIQRPLHSGWGLLRLSSCLCKGHYHDVLHTLWSTMINQCHTQRLNTVRCLSIFFVYQTNPALMPASPSQCSRCPSSPWKLCTSEGGLETVIFTSWAPSSGTLTRLDSIPCVPVTCLQRRHVCFSVGGPGFWGGSLYCWSVPRSRTLSLSLSVHTYMYTYIYTYIHTYIPHLAALSLFCSFKCAQPLFRSPKFLEACQAAMLDV